MGSSRQNVEGTTTGRGRTDRESGGDKPRVAFSSPTHSQCRPRHACSSRSRSLTAQSRPQVTFLSPTHSQSRPRHAHSSLTRSLTAPKVVFYSSQSRPEPACSRPQTGPALPTPR